MKSQPFEYIKKTYGVPAEIGCRVVVDGQSGIIVADCGQYIGGRLDTDAPDMIRNFHPTWRVEYLEPNKVVKICTECGSTELYTGGEIKEPRMCITCFAAMTGFTRIGDHFFDSAELEQQGGAE